MAYATTKLWSFEELEQFIKTQGDKIDNLQIISHGTNMLAVYKLLPVVEPVDDSPEPAKASEPVAALVTTRVQVQSQTT